MREDKNNNSDISFNEMIESLHENGMMYFYLVSLISADTLISVDNCNKSIHQLNMVIDNLSKSKIPEIDRAKYLKYCEDGLEICKRDKSELEKIN